MCIGMARCLECRQEYLLSHQCPVLGRLVTYGETKSYGKDVAMLELDPALRRARHDLVMQRERDRLEATHG
jgi:hypothetical protein